TYKPESPTSSLPVVPSPRNKRTAARSFRAAHAVRGLPLAAIRGQVRPDMYDLSYQRRVEASRSQAVPYLEELQHDLRSREASKCCLLELSQAGESRSRVIDTRGSRRSHYLLSVSLAESAGKRARHFILQHVS